MSDAEFQQKIYRQLDARLKSSDFNSGASEAHGLLTGLACRGIKSGDLQNKLFLFQLSADEDLLLLEGLLELIIRDLQSSTLTCNLLLPDDDAVLIVRADEMAGWCSGFIQGFCHDGDDMLTHGAEPVREILRDIMDIGGLRIDDPSRDTEEDEKAVMEIEEYLRAGVQLIYDETAATDRSAGGAFSDEIH